MKAFLLAAGLGSRLRPLTDHTPKCLIPICGKPILQIWLEHLAQAGVTEVLVNTHHLHDQVEAFAREWKQTPQLHLAYEPDLLGSAGTLRHNREFVKDSDLIYVIYADNLTRFKLRILAQTLQNTTLTDALGVMALHRTEEPQRCGIATVDSHTRQVTSFIEKPECPTSNLANSGIYLFHKDALSFLPEFYPSDIAHHFIPKLIPRLIGCELDVPLVDIGTPDSYAKAQNFSLD